MDLLGNQEEVHDIGARPVLKVSLGLRRVMYSPWDMDNVVIYSISQLSWKVEELEGASPFR